MNAQKTNQEKLEKRLLERDVAMKEMTWLSVYSEMTVNRLKTVRSLLMKKNEELAPCSSQMTTRSR